MSGTDAERWCKTRDSLSLSLALRQTVGGRDTDCESRRERERPPLVMKRLRRRTYRQGREGEREGGDEEREERQSE